MRADVGIHSARISFEEGAVARARHAERFLRGRPQAQNSLLAIQLERVLAQNLREFAAAEAAHHVHLPQAVLRRDISLGEEKVFQRRRFDGRHAVAVARHGDRRGEARRPVTVRPVGKGRVGDVIRVGRRARQSARAAPRRATEERGDRGTAGGGCR